MSALRDLIISAATFVILTGTSQAQQAVNPNSQSNLEEISNNISIALSSKMGRSIPSDLINCFYLNSKTDNPAGKAITLIRSSGITIDESIWQTPFCSYRSTPEELKGGYVSAAFWHNTAGQQAFVYLDPEDLPIQGTIDTIKANFEFTVDEETAKDAVFISNLSNEIAHWFQHERQDTQSQIKRELESDFLEMVITHKLARYGILTPWYVTCSGPGMMKACNAYEDALQQNPDGLAAAIEEAAPFLEYRQINFYGAQDFTSPTRTEARIMLAGWTRNDQP